MNGHLDDMRMMDHLQVLDFSGYTSLGLGILRIDCRLADALEGHPLLRQYMDGHWIDNRKHEGETWISN